MQHSCPFTPLHASARLALRTDTELPEPLVPFRFFSPSAARVVECIDVRVVRHASSCAPSPGPVCSCTLTEVKMAPYGYSMLWRPQPQHAGVFCTLSEFASRACPLQGSPRAFELPTTELMTTAAAKGYLEQSQHHQRD